LYLLRGGMEARTVEATAANAQSSRAHAVFSLSVDRVGRRSQRRGAFSNHGSEVRALHSKISLIDLAGSERAKDTHNSGSALKDGARINQSLLALANCIDALTARGGSRENRATAASSRKKPPYRDSKLTLMLKGSLTGDGLVAMIGNVHPGRSHFEDSNNTLEYAMRASAMKPREQRRCRASTAGGHPTGIPQVCSAKLTRRRQSLPAPASARGPRRCQAADEEEAICMPSSSTLPAPAKTGDRMRLPSKLGYGAQTSTRVPLDPKRTAFAWTTQNCMDVEAVVTGDSAAESTASSPGLASPNNELELELQCDDAVPMNSSTPEDLECLSELSLEDAGEVEDEESSSEADQLVDTQELNDCGAAGDTDCMAMLSPPAKGSGAISSFAVRMIEALQAEKAELDLRLRSTMSERDALLQDRVQLESANEKLREANLEKDQQLAALLFTAATPGASPLPAFQPNVNSPNGNLECGGCHRMLQLGRGTQDCPICQGKRAPKAVGSRVAA